MIQVSTEIKVKTTCDCLWGRNQCPNPAAFLLRHKKTTVYSIMCEVHKGQFASIYPNAPFEYYEWSVELNRKFAEEAKNGRSE